MKKILLILVLLPAILFAQSGTFTDSRDSKTYKWVKIGTQVWMAENLNYNPGTGNSACYKNNASNCTTYGRLYDWATAMGIDKKYNSETWNGSDAKHRGICPSGWHIPSNADWNVLMKFVNPSCSDNANCAGAGTKLKAASGWSTYSGIPIGTDDYGFSALPGGYGDSNGDFGYVGNLLGIWWSASEYGSYSAYDWGLEYNYEYASYSNLNKYYLPSVRCLQDQSVVLSSSSTMQSSSSNNVSSSSSAVLSSSSSASSSSVVVSSSSSTILSSESWFNFITYKNGGYASISNEGNPINAGGYAEVADVNLYIWSSWDNWAQATVGLKVENSGIDLAQCKYGFRYKYKGNEHRFSLESEYNNLQVTYYEDVLYSTSAWNEVRVNPFTRGNDEAYLAGYSNISLNLSKVKYIYWTVRPYSLGSVVGYLQIKDFECISSSSSANTRSSSSSGTTPIRQPQIAKGPMFAYTSGNAIILGNLPTGTKVEVYGLNGKLITTSHSPLATSHLGSDMSISVQTKGLYIVKAGTKIFRVAVR